VSLLVVDIGGTKVSSAWWRHGQLSQVRTRPMARDEAGFFTLLQDLHRDYPHAQQLGVAITGRAVAGVVRAVNAAMIGFWSGYPLAARMAGVGLPPPLLLNDAQAAAWGEFRADFDADDGRPSGEEGRGAGAGDEALESGRDLLFVGFDPARHWVIGIWLGNDDNSPTQASSALAAGLWNEIIAASGG
jgi:hypothetical protein